MESDPDNLEQFIEECAHCGKLIIADENTNLCPTCADLEDIWLAFDKTEKGEERERVDLT